MRIDINNDWLWSPDFNEDMLKLDCEGEDQMEWVRIPHTVSVTPLNYFDAHVYQMVSCYRKAFYVPSEWRGKRVFITQIRLGITSVRLHSESERLGNGSYN